ncbi:MAG: biopolymer transporter ExbD [Arenicellales bacterium]|jgi:biopolymer transport protein ExbD
MKFSSVPAEEVSINLTPLIDIVFLLLIFFMVSTTFNRETDLEIALPEARSEAAQPLVRQVISLVINAQGQYQLHPIGGDSDAPIRPRDADELAAALGRRPRSASNPTLVIRADAQTTHQAVILALDAARRAGLTRVTFAAQVSH